MAVASEISKIDADTLEKVKTVITLFHMIGITDEMLDKLPQILASWPTVVSNMNAMVEDLNKLKMAVYQQKPAVNQNSGDTPENLRKAVGFGETIERVVFEKGDGENE